MDEIVLRGIAKWPNVPAVFGWLALDRRGSWLIKGDRVTNPDIAAFIGRNYERDPEGQWFFQNGPQRVYVDLDYTPLIYRTLVANATPMAFETHTGVRSNSLCGAWIDDCGALLIETEQGLGLVDDRDLDALSTEFCDAQGLELSDALLDTLMQPLQRGSPAPMWLRFGESRVKIGTIKSSDVAGRFQFIAHPVAPETAAAC